MKPFRKNVALAVDGGGIKGVVASRAIAILEDHLQKPSYEIFKSTGSIISAGIATGLFGEEIHNLYCDMGPIIFKKTGVRPSGRLLATVIRLNPLRKLWNPTWQARLWAISGLLPSPLIWL